MCISADVAPTDNPHGFVPVPPQGPKPDRFRRPGGPPPPPGPSDDPRTRCTDNTVERRAQQILEKSLKATHERRPLLALSPKYDASLGEVGTLPLHLLSEDVQEHFRRQARQEADTWLRGEDARGMAKKAQKAIKAQLGEWAMQKEAVRAAEEQRIVEAAKEKERLAEEAEQKRKQRAVKLQLKVATWGADKADREDAVARKAAEEARDAKKRERDWRREAKRKHRYILKEKEARERVPHDYIVLQVRGDSGALVAELAVQETTPVSEVKLQIQQIMGVPTTQQQLTLSSNGAVLGNVDDSPTDVAAEQAAMNWRALGATGAKPLLLTYKNTGDSREPVVRCRKEDDEPDSKTDCD